MLKVYAVFDVKAASYGSPMFLASNGIALRTFGEVCLNPESPLHKYPEDFSLYEIGSYDPASGELKTIQPKHLASAAAVISGVASPAVAGSHASKSEMHASDPINPRLAVGLSKFNETQKVKP